MSTVKTILCPVAKPVGMTDRSCLLKRKKGGKELVRYPERSQLIRSAQDATMVSADNRTGIP
jgi:hypothetical protein